MTEPVILLVVYALAVARLTGLVTVDTITEDIRHGVIKKLDDRPRTLGAYVATLITCPWCAGMWVSAVAAPLVWFWGAHPALYVPALGLALSQAVGMLSEVGR